MYHQTKVFLEQFLAQSSLNSDYNFREPHLLLVLALLVGCFVKVASNMVGMMIAALETDLI